VTPLRKALEYYFKAYEDIPLKDAYDEEEKPEKIVDFIRDKLLLNNSVAILICPPESREGHYLTTWEYANYGNGVLGLCVTDSEPNTSGLEVINFDINTLTANYGPCYEGRRITHASSLKHVNEFDDPGPLIQIVR
jgi:hypothetical protein